MNNIEDIDIINNPELDNNESNSEYNNVDIIEFE